MGTIVYTNDQRVRAVHPNGTDSIDWNLDIGNADVEDSGVYECQINTEPKKSKAYVLQVVSKSTLKLLLFLYKLYVVNIILYSFYNIEHLFTLKITSNVLL